MALRIVEEYSLSDVGRQRHTNEDSFFDGSPIFAVADGMGGARAGEVASRLAVETFDEQRDESASPEAQLAEVAQAANRKIYKLAQQDSSRAGMGTTFTAVMLTDNELAIGHVGDSRAYRLRDGELERLTQDHSLVEELVRQGKIAPEEAETHPQRSIITRALGPEPDVDVETLTYPARAGDLYLLCSDGLTGMVNEQRVAELLKGSGSLEEAAHKLIDEANANGGRDNITAVLFRLGEGDAVAEEDSDTLSGREGGLQATTVAAAVRDADEADAAKATKTSDIPPGVQPTKPTEIPEELREGPPEEATMALGPEEAARARDAPRTSSSGARPRPDDTRVGRIPDAEGARPRRRRRFTAGLAALLALILIVLLCVGIYVGSRQFYFVGTNDRGVVTLYRGFPYELPFGIDMYEEEYVSSAPASSIEPDRRRKRIIDQQLRSHGDAVDLVRQVERENTR